MNMLLLLLAWMPHDFHASMARMERNDETGSVEITLHVFTDDLEAALAEIAEKRVVIDTYPDVDKLIMTYLKKHFRILAGDKQLEPEWIGMEVDVKTVWLFVELPPVAGLKGIQLHDTLFFDLFDDQVNTVNILGFGKRHTLIFQVDDEPKDLAASEQD